MEDNFSVNQSSHSKSIDDNSSSDTFSKHEIKKFEIISHSETYNKYYRTSKITKPFLTKYEKTKILGIRAQMISSGALPLVKVPEHIIKSIDIARLEFKEKKIPLMIRRYLPDNSYEDWRLEDLVYN